MLCRREDEEAERQHVVERQLIDGDFEAEDIPYHPDDSQKGKTAEDKAD